MSRRRAALRDGELRRVYREHLPSVFGFFAASVERHTAEDLSAATFERVIRAWGDYDPEQGRERQWVMTIARNLLMDHYRRSRHRDAVSVDEHPVLLLSHAVGSDWSEPSLTRVELRQRLARLKPREHEVLILRYGADLPAADIAELLGLSADNVHQIVSRALRKLRLDASTSVSSGVRAG